MKALVGCNRTFTALQKSSFGPVSAAQASTTQHFMCGTAYSGGLGRHARAETGRSEGEVAQAVQAELTGAVENGDQP